MSKLQGTKLQAVKRELYAICQRLQLVPYRRETVCARIGAGQLEACSLQLVASEPPKEFA